MFISTLADQLKAVDFNKIAGIISSDQRAKILNTGRDLHYAFWQSSGSASQSKNEYLFRRFDMQLELVPGDSAETVPTIYVSYSSSYNIIMDILLSRKTCDPYICQLTYLFVSPSHNYFLFLYISTILFHLVLYCSTVIKYNKIL